MVYDVRVARTEEEVRDLLQRPEVDLHSVAILEETPPSTPSVPERIPPWTATITSFRNNSIDLDVSTDHDGFLVLSETFYPGWKATVDGQETSIHRTNYCLRGLFIPRGTHSVKVWFAPASFTAGLWITLLTILVCAGGIVISMVNSKRALRTGDHPPLTQ
jgi:uncharacterized membrane protein YfhO